MMEQTLTRFVRALRASGAPVSSAETLDAARTLALIGYDDREALKTAFGSVLAKSLDEIELHDKMFDLFFSRPASDDQPPPKAENLDDGADEQDGDKKGEGDSGQSNPESASPTGDLPGKGQAQGGQAPSSPSGGEGKPPPVPDAESFMELAQSGDGPRIEAAMRRAAHAVGADDIRFATQTAWFTRKMLEELGVRDLEAKLLEAFSGRTKETRAAANAMIEARHILQEHAREHVKQLFEVFGRGATDSFMEEVVTDRAIPQLSMRDMERMRAIVAKLAKRLAIKHARRRRVRNSGRLDVRKTLHANAGHGGIPFDVVWKQKRKDKPRIVAICDVSGSVAQYVRFLLMFLQALQGKVADLRTFAFCNDLIDVEPFLKENSLDGAMEAILRKLGGGTDYGQALTDLRNKHWEAIDRRTTVLILGDGRSNYSNPRLEIMEELADSAKRVVWLCPEGPSQWGSGDSCMLDYKTYCTRLSRCATAGDLETAIDDILLAYN
jgi:uncharacterized protein